MIKFFADECVHIDVISALRENGFDVLDVREAGISGSDDEAVFNFAKAHKRVLLTFDRGFGDIFRFNISKSPGVIIVLIHKMSGTEIIKIVLGFANFIQSQNFKGKLAIIGKTKIRISQR